MSRFNLRAEAGAWPRFGDYAVVEQKRHGAPNEMYYHKVVATLTSNSWVDVPVQASATATLHETSERVAIVICCGVDESETYRVRVADLHKVELSGRPVAVMSEWLPIESAPEDGTEILLAAIGQTFDGVPLPPRVTLGHYKTGDELFKDVGDCGGSCHCREYEELPPFWLSWDGGFTEENPPTHWMPLPSPPST